MATGIRVGLVDADSSIRLGRRMVLDAALDMSVVFEEDSVARVIDKFADYLLDVLLVEQRLRGTTGIELTEVLTEIKIANANNTRILVTSVFSTPELELSAFKAGASGFVSQDLGPHYLLEQIRKINSRSVLHSRGELHSLWENAAQTVSNDVSLSLYLENLVEVEVKTLKMLVEGHQGSTVSQTLEIPLYRVRKSFERALTALHLATLEQLQLRFIGAGIRSE